MTQYINKDVVITEIQRLQDSIQATAIDGRISKEQAEAYKICVKLRSFVEDTIDAKEAALKEEIDKYVNIPENQDNPELKEELFKCALRIASIGWNNGYLKGQSSFKEEVSEDLEKDLNNQLDSIYPLPEEDDFDDPCYSVSNAIRSQRIGFKKGFKVGVGRQKEHMLKDAIEAVFIQDYGYTKPVLLGNLRRTLNVESRDKVKLIIVKDD